MVGVVLSATIFFFNLVQLKNTPYILKVDEGNNGGLLVSHIELRRSAEQYVWGYGTRCA